MSESGKYQSFISWALAGLEESRSAYDFDMANIYIRLIFLISRDLRNNSDFSRALYGALYRGRRRGLDIRALPVTSQELLEICQVGDPEDLKIMPAQDNTQFFFPIIEEYRDRFLDMARPCPLLDDVLDIDKLLFEPDHLLLENLCTEFLLASKILFRFQENHQDNTYFYLWSDIIGYRKILELILIAAAIPVPK